MKKMKKSKTMASHLISSHHLSLNSLSIRFEEGQIGKHHKTVMPKDNLIFKLDNLEYQYNYLRGTLDSFRPRLTSTSKSYNAKGKKSSRRMSKLLNELRLEDVEMQLDQLREEIFRKKVYHLDERLRQHIVKQIHQYKPSKKSKNDFTAVIKKLSQKYGIEHFAALASKSKAIKLSLAKINLLKKAPKWLTRHEYWQIHNNKKHEYNPSRVWNEVVVETDGCNQLLSSFMNNDKCKALIAGFNSGMDLFLAINKDNKEKLKKGDVKQSSAGRTVINKLQKGKDQGEGADKILNSAHEGEQEGEDLLRQRDQMLTASDEDERSFELDSKIDYNKVTDTEPSDDEVESEDEFKQPATKKPRYDLPELMAGYYSGEDSDSENDLSNDEVALQQISTKVQRKNRRGQRARRKIWEQKFGSKANHIIKERTEIAQKREKNQKEYEERAAKRAAKAAAGGVSASAFGQQPKRDSKPMRNETFTAEHPSWIAKREAEAKLKNAKFEGKKVKFD